MALFLVWLFELVLGLITINGVTMTFWIALIVVGLAIKEVLKLI
jgi:hypothetical protein